MKIEKRDNFWGIYFCDWSSGNVLRNLFLRFREKSTKINSALINFEKINSFKVIFKANYGNIAKSQN